MDANMTVELGERTIKLVAPTDMIVCHEIRYTSAVNTHRAAAAALMVCWPMEADPKGKNRRQRRKKRQEKADRVARLETTAGTSFVKRPRMRYTGQPLVDGAAFANALLKQSERCGFDYNDIFTAGMIALALVMKQTLTEDDLREVEDSFFGESEELAEE